MNDGKGKILPFPPARRADHQPGCREGDRAAATFGSRVSPCSAELTAPPALPGPVPTSLGQQEHGRSSTGPKRVRPRPKAALASGYSEHEGCAYPQHQEKAKAVAEDSPAEGSPEQLSAVSCCLPSPAGAILAPDSRVPPGATSPARDSPALPAGEIPPHPLRKPGQPHLLHLLHTPPTLTLLKGKGATQGTKLLGFGVQDLQDTLCCCSLQKLTPT